MLNYEGLRQLLSEIEALLEDSIDTLADVKVRLDAMRRSIPESAIGRIATCHAVQRQKQRVDDVLERLDMIRRRLLFITKASVALEARTGRTPMTNILSLRIQRAAVRAKLTAGRIVASLYDEDIVSLAAALNAPT